MPDIAAEPEISPDTETHPQRTSEQPYEGKGRPALIVFPWQVWLGLFSLFLIFIGIGSTWFWVTDKGGGPVPDWVPIFMTIMWLVAGGGVLALLLWMWREFIRFGDDLSFWASGMREGDLDIRMPIRKSGCLSVRTREQINAITDDYEALSRKQHQRLNRQKRFIEQKKHHLNVLYDVASSINRADNLENLLQRFLVTLKNVVNAKAVAVRLRDSNDNMRLVASIGLDHQVMERENVVPSKQCVCAQAADNCAIRAHENLRPCQSMIQHPFFPNDDNVRMLAIPLQYRDKVLGIYNLFVPQSRAANLDEEYELLTSVGQHLGMAIEKANVDEEARTLSIMEERTRMAHELHDSLAQTLASLRFKVRLFDDSLNRGDEATIWQELEGLENTIDDAYSELRSLITDFRAPLDGKDVVRAVKNLSERFRKDTDLEVFFYHNWSLKETPAEIELEVVRIVQEALNNVKKHSQASTVRILMYSSDEGKCSVLVEDDGVGLPEVPLEPDPITGEHIGLQIMKERATKLNGELQFESDPDEGGTLIQLAFDIAHTRSH